MGEFGRCVKDRIREHLYSIDKFVPYNKHTPVSCHFNLSGHNKKYFRFMIFRQNLSEL